MHSAYPYQQLGLGKGLMSVYHLTYQTEELDQEAKKRKIRTLYNLELFPS